jgi:hypothetical protein
VGVGLARPASTLTVRSVDFHHRDPQTLEIAGQPGAVAAGAFDTDQHHRTQRREPLDELAIARRCRRERRGSQQAAALIQRGSDVHLEVGIDATRDLWSHVRVFSLQQPIGKTPALPGRRTRQRRASTTGS